MSAQQDTTNNISLINSAADDQLNSLVASGILSPVTDSSVKSDNIDAAVEAASIDGKIYAYPMTADDRVLGFDSRAEIYGYGDR